MTNLIAEYCSQELERLRLEFESGDDEALRFAMCVCEWHEQLPPAWLWRELHPRIQRTMPKPLQRQQYQAARWCLERLEDHKGRWKALTREQRQKVDRPNLFGKYPLTRQGALMMAAEMVHPGKNPETIWRSIEKAHDREVKRLERRAAPTYPPTRGCR